MSVHEWEEVKRLAADFQRAQLTSAVQKLSERNCIEIVNKLVECKLLDVVFTTDGKEYVTPQQVQKEIKDDLCVHGGRIPLIELVHLLNVDINVINAQLPLLEGRDDCKVLMGHLLDQSYMNKLSEEISDKLDQQGILNINELIKIYDLPADFLQNAIKRNLGKPGKKIYQDSYDEKVFYTDLFLLKLKAIVRGALLAITKPTSVQNIVKQCSILENLFYTAHDILTHENQIPGALSEKRGTSCTYIPLVYSKKQNEWATNFVRQNGYIEFDALSRLGVFDPHAFVRNHFQSEKLFFLPTAAIGQQLISQVEATVEETLATGSFTDIMDDLPSVFEPEDGAVILKEALKRSKLKQQPPIYLETIVMSEEYFDKIIQFVRENLLHKNVESAVNSGDFLKAIADSRLKGANPEVEFKDVKANRKDERRKVASSGKGGGGAQGRETKTKSTKKKYLNRGKAAQDSSDEDLADMKKPSAGMYEFFTLKDVQSTVKEILLQSSEDTDYDTTELSKEISLQIYPALNKESFSLATELCEKKIADSSSNRRKVAVDIQERLTTLFNDIKFYEKGTKHFQSKDIQKQLIKYLLKTLGAELVNLIFHYVCVIDTEPSTISAEMRMKLIAEAEDENRNILSKLNKSLGSDSLEDFVSVVEETLAAIRVVIKKQDKKRERSLIMAHKQALLSEMDGLEEPAAVLHLASLVLFQTVTQSMLHASGKFVSSILAFLEPHLPPDTFSHLREFHDSVLKFLTIKAEDETHQIILKDLRSKIPTIKEIAKNFKQSVGVSN
ncbi:unnamed protein product [Bemisia tabaci]|uniref:E3 UFM1-protein ligase 1 homolog n=1 Tax=Bemisia tabaci TaxID=7038 RepID=A0A9P0A7M9_BEMTA|nr:PREDICTED: E3 UFM1-protein ligase 1 homolog [Bemisia tabaci]CAH0385879.1 unnamed protein product [Bemisia tabaci]